MSKRSSESILNEQSKKPYTSNLIIPTAAENDKPLSKTHSALLSIRNLFPVNRFYNKISPVVMIHQLYDLLPSRTTVDREIKLLQTDGKICVFKLGIELLARAVILTEDLIETAKVCYPNNSLVMKFLNTIIPLGIIEIDKTYLMEKSFTPKEISDLMHCGYLVFSNTCSYLLSFPNAGHFMKAYVRGRRTILQIVRKSKYGEILQTELEERRLEKTVVLGTVYQVHDVVGADLVQSIDTTTGRLLRLKK